MTDNGQSSQSQVIEQQKLVALGNIVKQLAAVLPSVQSTAPTATAGGGASLPATVLGFINTTLPNGTAVKIPYYSP